MAPTTTTTPTSISNSAVDLFLKNVHAKFKFNPLKYTVYSSSSPVTYLYHKYSVYLFTVLYCLQAYRWHCSKTIFCFKQSYAEEFVIQDVVNFCLSYSYLEMEGKKRVYIMHYRWIPWCILFLIVLFYTPKQVVKFTSCTLLVNFFKRITTGINECNYTYRTTDKTDKEDVLAHDIAEYLSRHKGYSNASYANCVVVHVYTLLVNILGIYLLDLMLDGKFISYVPRIYFLSQNNIQTFKGGTFEIFPPFVDCATSTNDFGVGRQEFLRCHLPFMEMYERCFVIIWVWLAGLLTLNVCYLLYLLSLKTICVRYFLFGKAVGGGHRIGDVFLYYKVSRMVNKYVFDKAMDICNCKKTITTLA